MSIKLTIKSWKTSKHPLQKGFYIFFLLFWRTFIIPFRLLFSPKHRSLLLLKYFSKHDIHQISNYTEFNRYPDLFSSCSVFMQGKKNLTILSYGCSTGEEVFTLRKYFPKAKIVGVDINKTNIRKAHRQNNDSRIVFSDEIKNTLAEYGPFDLIFALAVLQRTENRKENIVESSNIYPFEKFNAKLSELDSYLKPNGLFVIDHADYLFEEADIYSHYRALKGEHNTVHERYLFDKENRKMSEYVTHHRIFVKTFSDIDRSV
ncbi:trans-aconitate 2-methyltransferase [Sulfurovum sp.]|uniref:class I SAM-dependent methyltransferase n=1 Tax=Sulfurovum sp. TaxID=1969726 RepID=UPI003561458A